MTLSERSAYLKGLMDGLKIDGEKPEGKMIRAIVDMLEEVAGAISEVEENARNVSDKVDEIEEELDTLSDLVFDDGDDEDDYDDDFEYDDSLYEIKCPTCGEIVTLDETVLEEGSIVCPKCGEVLEFDSDDILEEEDSDFDI